jgi:hypothetical protein
MEKLDMRDIDPADPYWREEPSQLVCALVAREFGWYSRWDATPHEEDGVIYAGRWVECGRDDGDEVGLDLNRAARWLHDEAGLANEAGELLEMVGHLVHHVCPDHVCDAEEDQTLGDEDAQILETRRRRKLAKGAGA